MALSAQRQLTDQDVRSVSSTQSSGVGLGEVMMTTDGQRRFAYGLNGNASTALAPGKLNQGAVLVANHLNRTGVTYSAGATQVIFTLGNTAPTAHQYDNGWFFVNAGTGVGQTLQIVSHNVPAVSASTYPNFTLNLGDGLYTATAVADSKFSVMPNAFSAAIIADRTAPTAVIPVGVSEISVPGANYAWFQVGGPCAVLANGTPAAGGALIPSATTDGAVDVDGATSVQPKVGYALQVAVSGEYRMVNLTINPF